MFLLCCVFLRIVFIRIFGSDYRKQISQSADSKQKALLIPSIKVKWIISCKFLFQILTVTEITWRDFNFTCVILLLIWRLLTIVVLIHSFPAGCRRLLQERVNCVINFQRSSSMWAQQRTRPTWSHTTVPVGLIMCLPPHRTTTLSAFVAAPACCECRTKWE